MMKSIHDIYARDETFLDELAQDLEDGAAWFNESEFARFHTIEKKKVISIFTSDVKSKSITIRVGNNQNPEGIQKSQGILFCRVQDIKGNFKADSPLHVDGKLYTISEAKIIQDQIWRVVLEANN